MQWQKQRRQRNEKKIRCHIMFTQFCFRFVIIMFTHTPCIFQQFIICLPKCVRKRGKCVKKKLLRFPFILNAIQIFKLFVFASFWVSLVFFFCYFKTFRTNNETIRKYVRIQSKIIMKELHFFFVYRLADASIDH